MQGSFLKAGRSVRGQWRDPLGRYVQDLFASMRKAGLLLLALTSLLLGPLAHAAGAQYVYDPAGRLVQVIAPNGSSAVYSYDPAGNLTAITPLSASTAAITGFSTVTSAPGQTLIIYGSGFSTTPANNLVYINGLAVSVVSATTNTLEVVLPSGAATGPVTVTNANGTVLSSTSLVVDSAIGLPVITNFTPSVVGIGSAVTISGSGFQTVAGENRVYFPETRGTVTTASSTSLGATIPAGAWSGPIAVATPYGSTRSTQDLFVVPPGNTVSDIGSTARLPMNGSVQTLSIATTEKIALALFDGTDGQVVRVDLSDCDNVTQVFLDAPGANGYQGQISCSQGGQSTKDFVLPVTGTYVLRAFRMNAAAASVDVRVSSTSTTAGTIDVDGAAVTVTTTTAGQQVSLSFSAATANQVIKILPSSSTFSSGCALQKALVLGPADASMVIAEGDLCAAFGVTLPVGEYFLKVVPYGTNVGSVSVQLQTTSPVTGSVSIGGSPVTVTTTSPGQRAALSLTSSTDNQGVVVQPSGVTFQQGCYFQTLAIRGPSPQETEVHRMDLCSARAAQLPHSGTYTVEIVPYGTDSGNATIEVDDVPLITSAITIDGAPVTATTTLPGQQAELTFPSSYQNQVISIQLSDCTFWDCWSGVLMVSGPPPARTYFTSITLDTQAQLVTLPNVGSYTLTVIPYDTDAGSVTVALQDAPAITEPIEIDGAVASATTTIPGQAVQFIFETTVDDTDVVIQPSAAFWCDWIITGPTLATTAYDWVDSGSCMPGPVTIPTAGTYALTVVPSDGVGTGAVSMKIVTQPSPITGSISIGGSAVTATTTVPAQSIQFTISNPTAYQKVSVQKSNWTFSASCNSVAMNLKGSNPLEQAISVDACPGQYSVQLGGSSAYTMNLPHYYPGVGGVTWQLSSINDVTASLTIGGSPVTVTTTVPLQEVLATFTNATANTAVTIRTASSTFPGSCGNHQLQLLAPNGSLLAQLSLCTTAYPRTLTDVGTYTLRLIPGNRTVGSVSLQVTAP